MPRRRARAVKCHLDSRSQDLFNRVGLGRTNLRQIGDHASRRGKSLDGSRLEQGNLSKCHDEPLTQLPLRVLEKSRWNLLAADFK